MEQPTRLTQGLVIGGAILEDEIGFGGQARVFRASYMGEAAAVKIVLPMWSSGNVDKILARFEREQEVLLTLSHPNIVSVHAAGTAKVSVGDRVTSVPYLIMELMSGPSMPDMSAPLPWHEVVRIGIDAAKGLQAAHKHGIVHRDIKPTNILLSGDGTAKVSDFGLAGFFELGVYSGGLTPRYASPEQHDLSLIAADDLPAKGPDELSDIYSLGVTFFQMLSGHLPYTGAPEKISLYFKRLIPVSPLDVEAPTPLIQLVERMVSIRRCDRPRHVSEIIAVLDSLRQDSPSDEISVIVTQGIDQSSERTVADGVKHRSKPKQTDQRFVTVAFIEMIDPSENVRKLPLDHYVDVMNDCFERIEEVISKYEGSVKRLTGNSMLAFFGVPLVHENDAERAVFASLEIRDTAKGQGLNVSIGVNTGMVYTEEMDGAPGSGAWGPDVGIAKRLQESAGIGEIWIGRSTYGLSSGAFVFDAPVDLELKGIGKNQIAYPVLRAREQPKKTRGIESLRPQMIGRERELGDLMGCVNALVKENKGQIATVVGEAGIGKSRLVRELRRRVQNRGVKWLEGRCLSIGRPTNFWPFIDILRTYLGISSEDSESEIRDKIIQNMLSLFGQQAEDIIPYVAQLLSIRLDEQYQKRIQNMTPEQMRHQTLARIRDVFVAIAHKQPLILVLEDLHWADDLSFDLLWVLMDELVNVPILLICIHRPEHDHGCCQMDETASRKHIDRYTRITLKPLTTHQGQQMLESLLRAESLPTNLKKLILARAEGNPLYMEELIRLLIERGNIYLEDEQWKTKEVIDEIGVPDTIQEIISARADRFRPEVKHVLQNAAVIGRTFQHRLLSHLLVHRRRTEECLSELEFIGFIYRERAFPELEYAFGHILAREAIYQMIPSREQQTLHKRVGEGIEMLYEDQIEEYCEQLAYHYLQSGNREKAFEYLLKSGQKSARQYANEQALDYFQQALDSTKDKDKHSQALKCRAKLLLDLYRGKEAVSDYGQLLESAKQDGNCDQELESLLGLASAYYIMALNEADFAAKSIELHKQAYALARSMGNKAAMVRVLVSSLGLNSFRPEYADETMSKIEEALSLSQELGDENLKIDSKIAKMHFLQRCGNRKQAEQLGESLLCQLGSRHDLNRLIETYYWLIWTHLGRGNFEKCAKYCDACMKLSEEVGVLPVQYPSLKALALLNMGCYGSAWESMQKEIVDQEHLFGRVFRDQVTGIYFYELMDYAEAAEKLSSVVEQAEHIGRIWLSRWAQRDLIRCLIRQGKIDQADKAAQDSISRWGKLPTSTMAESALSKDKLDEALGYAEELCSEAEETEARANYVSALELKLRILLRLDRFQESVDLAGTGIRLAEEMKRRPMVWRIKAMKAQALEKLGKKNAAAQEYAAAAAIIHKLAETIPDEGLKRILMSSSPVSSILESVQRGKGEG